MTTHVAATLLKKHPHFNLLLPVDSVLEQLVGVQIISRVVCHEWPLSCVERIEFAGGPLKYCKTTRPPSREIDVYSSLQSEILVPHHVVRHDPDGSILLLDSFSGSPLTREVVESAGAPKYFGRIREKLSTLSGERPVFLDLSSVDRVREQFGIMLERLYRLFGSTSDAPISIELLQVATDTAKSPAVERSIIDDPVYSNGDLSADNILVMGDDTRIIDWQFPRLASLSVEMVNLYMSLGMNPRTILPDAAIAASLLLKVRWFAECAELWVPDGGYQELISQLLGQIAAMELEG